VLYKREGNIKHQASKIFDILLDDDELANCFIIFSGKNGCKGSSQLLRIILPEELLTNGIQEIYNCPIKAEEE